MGKRAFPGTLLPRFQKLVWDERLPVPVMSYDEAFEYVRRKRPHISPNFGFVLALRHYGSRKGNSPAPFAAIVEAPHEGGATMRGEEITTEPKAADNHASQKLSP